MKPRRALTSIAALVTLELAVAAVVLEKGFVALSDDDFSRVVIAERFAALPSLDPSGTSWLPLPFLLLGTAMAPFGRTLAVARAVAVAESVFALVLVYRAARHLAGSRRAALASAAIAAVLPTAARLGVSFQPEALTAGLVLFGATSAVRSGRERLLGGLALGAATLCRYEAWPAALAFALFCFLDLSKARSGIRDAGSTVLAFASALSATLPGAAWMLHGALVHGSAVFFLHRVASYRAALGDREPLPAALVAYLDALVRSEPELVAVVVTLLFEARASSRARTSTGARYLRPAAILGALFAFLVVGRLLGGAPTHHDERPLLSIFWGFSVLVGMLWLGEPAGVDGAGDVRHSRLVKILAALAVCGVVFRWTRHADTSFDRRAELAIGADARGALGDRDRLLVDTADYGYFATIAAFGAPERAEPFDRRDPRDVPVPDPFSSPNALASRLRASSASWFVARREHDGIASAVGSVTAQNDEFVLCRVNDRAEDHR